MKALNISGLKCDNPSCGYQDNTIQLEEYENYINFPCPDCGESLLTEEDYNTVMDLVEQYGGLEYNGGPKITVKGELDGSEDIDMSIASISKD